MAGTIAFSLSQRFDRLGKPLAGGKLYFFQAGTSTPQSAYQDSALTLELPNPIILDEAGNVPQFFLADGSIKIRLDNSVGVTQQAADGILVIGASSGGGGGSPVDATTVLGTGDLKVRYGTGALSGFVRCNGRTIGSALSSATERPNADTEALFLFLYAVDANLAVSGGRGANAAADWAANKTIALPDWRGRVIAGLDDMGNSAASRLTSTYFGAAATTLGVAGGSEWDRLTTAKLPAHAHTIDITDPTHHHGTTTASRIAGTDFLTGNLNAGGFTFPNGNQDLAGAVTTSVATGITAAAQNTGGGEPHNNTQPTMLATIYIKL